ncbi:hypothetical protein [Sphingobium yanoikuyae]|uniref:hypothetical protein n=1 Tax=Sphingobium yanoikuyae TaxID=13690 RepID=UPI0031DB2446
MAIVGTTIADLVPSEKAMASRVDLLLPAKNPLINSGLAVGGPEVDAVLPETGSRKQGLAFIEPLDTTKVNISTDDITQDGESGKLTADEFSVIRHEQNFAWGYADLARMITAYGIEGGISAGISQYWNTRFQKTAVASIKGVLAHIEAVIAAGTTGTPTAEQVAKKDEYLKLIAGANNTAFSMTNVFKAAATAEEYADMFDTAIVHPNQYAKWQSEESSSFLTPAQTGSQFASYRGFKLIKDTSFGEQMTVFARTGGIAFGARGNEIENERLANKGNGGGANLLHSRQGFVCHIQGTNYAGATAPTLDTLALAATWNLAVPAAQFGFRFIKHAKPF